MHSCIYSGRVRHRRFAPVAHQFSYPISYLYLDLEELPEVVRRVPLLSTRRRGLAAIRRQDHFGDPHQDLAETVRGFLDQETGQRPDGAIRMLTLWSIGGFFFSPVNFFFCFPASDTGTAGGEQGHAEPTAVVVEVNTTPWRERFCYVLWDGNRIADRRAEYSAVKERHVSPFLDLGLQYRWCLSTPGREQLTIHIEAGQDPIQLDSTLQLRRAELTTSNWLLRWARQPLVPAQVLAGIYWEALRLWIKKAPFYAHPDKRPPRLDPPRLPGSSGEDAPIGMLK